jgi:hypothetical protein
MPVRSALLIAAAVLAGPAIAAEPAAPSKALQSKEVDQPIKNALFVCLYENPFGKVSDATTKVLIGNKLDPKDANKVLTVMAGVCGFRPGGSATPPPGVAPKSGPQQQPKSR